MFDCGYTSQYPGGQRDKFVSYPVMKNFWLFVFGRVFNAAAIVIQDFEAVVNKGFFHGYSVLMILNHAFSGIAVSMVMKYADNIVKDKRSDEIVFKAMGRAINKTDDCGAN